MKRRCATASTPWTATSDRKSTRLNSSHDQISYAVFCLKKKKSLVVQRADAEDTGLHAGPEPEHEDVVLVSRGRVPEPVFRRGCMPDVSIARDITAAVV